MAISTAGSSCRNPIPSFDAETKELVAGYAIIQTKSKEEAIELTKRFLKVVGEGESEVRLMHDVPAFG